MMNNESIPEELLVIRGEIDRIDEQLVRLLAQRFVLTNEVGRLKAAKHMDAVDPGRESYKLDQIRSLSRDLDLNPQMVADIFTQVMAEAVRNHRRFGVAG